MSLLQSPPSLVHSVDLVLQWIDKFIDSMNPLMAKSRSFPETIEIFKNQVNPIVKNLQQIKANEDFVLKEIQKWMREIEPNQKRFLQENFSYLNKCLHNNDVIARFQSFQSFINQLNLQTQDSTSDNVRQQTQISEKKFNAVQAIPGTSIRRGQISPAFFNNQIKQSNQFHATQHTQLFRMYQQPNIDFSSHPFGQPVKPQHQMVHQKAVQSNKKEAQFGQIRINSALQQIQAPKMPNSSSALDKITQIYGQQPAVTKFQNQTMISFVNTNTKEHSKNKSGQFYFENSICYNSEKLPEPLGQSANSAIENVENLYNVSVLTQPQEQIVSQVQTQPDQARPQSGKLISSEQRSRQMQQQLQSFSSDPQKLVKLHQNKEKKKLPTGYQIYSQKPMKIPVAHSSPPKKNLKSGYKSQHSKIKMDSQNRQNSSFLRYDTQIPLETAKSTANVSVILGGLEEEQKTLKSQQKSKSINNVKLDGAQQIMRYAVVAENAFKHTDQQYNLQKQQRFSDQSRPQTCGTSNNKKVDLDTNLFTSFNALQKTYENKTESLAAKKSAILGISNIFCESNSLASTKIKNRRQDSIGQSQHVKIVQDDAFGDQKEANFTFSPHRQQMLNQQINGFRNSVGGFVIATPAHSQKLLKNPRNMATQSNHLHTKQGTLAINYANAVPRLASANIYYAKQAHQQRISTNETNKLVQIKIQNGPYLAMTAFESQKSAKSTSRGTFKQSGPYSQKFQLINDKLHVTVLGKKKVSQQDDMMNKSQEDN